MNKLSTFALALFVAIITMSCSKNEYTYYAKDFGIVPNKQINISPLILEVLDYIKANSDGAPSTLIFEKGDYDFMIEGAARREYYISNHDQDNPKIVAIPIEDISNFTLDGGGSNFYVHGRMLPISIISTENCKVKNVHIDNKIPQISQIEIVENNREKGEVTYKLADYVQYRIEDRKLIVYGENWEGVPNSAIAFNPGKRNIVYKTSDIWNIADDVEQIGDRLIKSSWKSDKLEKGMVLAYRIGPRPTPGIFLHLNRDTYLENVDIHYAEGMGLLAQLSENITLTNCSVALRGDDDPRYFTTQADATHFSGCKGIIRSVGGLYEGMMDDAINVHGTYLKVVGRESDNTLIGRYMHRQAYGFKWGDVGDKVQFVNSETMELIGGENEIVSITPFDKPEIAGAKEFRIIFKESVDSLIDEKSGFGIENLEWTPEVVFSDNLIRNNRARGTLFSTPKPTLIENNVFDHTSGTAILLCGDCNGWYETGACRDVVIRGNTFVNSLTNMFQFTNAIISIYPEIPNLADQKLYFHGGEGKGVVIENNRFETFDKSIVYAKSIDGLVFRGNTIVDNNDFEPFHWNNHRFLFERATNVVIEDNSFESGFDETRDVVYK